jgi:hypothetical protein
MGLNGSMKSWRWLKRDYRNEYIKISVGFMVFRGWYEGDAGKAGKRKGFFRGKIGTARKRR